MVENTDIAIKQAEDELVQHSRTFIRVTFISRTFIRVRKGEMKQISSTV